MKNRIPVWSALLIAVGTAVLTLVLSFGVQLVMDSFSERDEYYPSDKLDEALAVIDRYYVGDWDAEELTDAALTGVVEALGDRWSFYLPADMVREYMNDSENLYDGIGIVISKRAEGGLLITSVYDVSPAADAGIIAGSVIYSVDGEDITDYTLDEAKAAIAARIAEGEVSLTLTDPDGAERTVALRPGRVELIPVSYSMLDGGVGYIHIENFKARSADLMIEAVEALRADGASSLLFDVRNNPGGSLDELLKALDYLLPQGVLFVSQTKGGAPMREYSDPSCVEMPMAVLINSESYSAAEFFSAALSEYGWATLVGEKTTGKGHAQTTIGLSDGSALHISIEEYFTPNGVCLDNVGLTPDVEVPLSEEDFSLLYYEMLAPEDDEQLIAAAALLTD